MRLRQSPAACSRSNLRVEASATVTGNTSDGGAGTEGGVYPDNAANTLTAVAGSISGNTPDQCAGLGISC
ncbi:MAG: hypothetical protein ACKOWF_11985 [Chloroflexota bacterium]